MWKRVVRYLLKKTLIVRIAGVAVLFFIPVWLGAILPEFIGIPEDYGSESEMEGWMQMLNETSYRMERFNLSIPSTTRTLSATDDEITLETNMSIINSDTGEHLSEFESPPEKHTIDRHSLEYVDDTHQGRYGFPIGLEKYREYDWWNSFINRTSTVTYVGEEMHEGMPTYRHEIREDNVSMGEGPIEGTQMYYSTLITLWLDPKTGLPIDIDQYQWRYLTFPDMRKIPDGQFEPDPANPMLLIDGTISIINESTLELETAEVTIEGWVRLDGETANGNVLKLNQTVKIYDKRTGELFKSTHLDNPTTTQFGVDTKTCKYVYIPGYSTDHRTGQFIFPVGQILDPETNEPRRQFTLWDDYLQQEVEAELRSEETVKRYGIDCLVYDIEAEGSLAPMEVKGYTLEVEYRSHTTRYVDPITGLTVDENYSQLRTIRFPDLRKIPYPLGKNNLSDPDVVMIGEITIINATTFDFDTYPIEVKAVLRDDGLIHDGKVLKLNQTLYIYDRTTGELLHDPNIPNPSSTQFAVHRTTTEYVYIEGYSSDRRTGHFIFPIGILDEHGEPIKRVTMWDADLGAEVKAKLVSPDPVEINGIECYKYIKHAKGEMPAMEVEGYTLQVELDATEALYVEPNTGLTVDSFYDATRLITFPDLRWIPYPTGNADPSDPDVVMNGSLSIINETTLEYSNHSIRIEASLQTDGLWDRERVILLNQTVRIYDEATGELFQSDYIDNPSYSQFGVNRINTRYVQVPGYSDGTNRVGHFIFPIGILDEHGEPMESIEMWDDYSGEATTATLASPVPEVVEGVECYRYEMRSVAMLEPMVVQGYTIQQELDNTQLYWVEPNTGLSVDSTMLQKRDLMFPDVAKIPTKIGEGDPSNPDQVQEASVRVINIDGISYNEIPYDEYDLEIEVTMRTDCLINISGSNVEDISDPSVVSWSDAESIGVIDMEILCLNVTQRRYDTSTGELVDHTMIDPIVSEQYGIDRKTGEFVYVPGYSSDRRTGHLVFPIGQVEHPDTHRPIQSLTMWDAALDRGNGKEVVAKLRSEERVEYHGLDCYVYEIRSYGYIEPIEMMGYTIEMTQRTNQTIYVEHNTGMSVNTITDQQLDAHIPDLKQIPPDYETVLEYDGIMLHDLPWLLEQFEPDVPQNLSAEATVDNMGLGFDGSAIRYHLDANVSDADTGEYLPTYSYTQNFSVLRDDSSYINDPGWTQPDMAIAYGQFVFPVCVFENDWFTPMQQFQFWDQDLQTTIPAQLQPPIDYLGDYWDPPVGYPEQWYYNESAPDEDVTIPPDGFHEPLRWFDEWYYDFDDGAFTLTTCDWNPNLFTLHIGNDSMDVALYVVDEPLTELPGDGKLYKSIAGYDVRTTHKKVYKESFIDPYSGLTVFSRDSTVEWYDWPMDGDDLEPWLWTYLHEPIENVPRYIREIRDLGRYIPWTEEILLGGKLDYSLDNETLDTTVEDVEENSQYIIYSSDRLRGATIDIANEPAYRQENAREIENNSVKIQFSEKTIHGVNISYSPEREYNRKNIESIRENSRYIVYSKSTIDGAVIEYAPRYDPQSIEDIKKNRRGLKLTSRSRALVMKMFVSNDEETIETAIAGVKEMQNLLNLGETIVPTLLFLLGLGMVFAVDVRPLIRKVRDRYRRGRASQLPSGDETTREPISTAESEESVPRAHARPTDPWAMPSGGGAGPAQEPEQRYARGSSPSFELYDHPYRAGEGPQGTSRVYPSVFMSTTRPERTPITQHLQPELQPKPQPQLPPQHRERQQLASADQKRLPVGRPRPSSSSADTRTAPSERRGDDTRTRGATDERIYRSIAEMNEPPAPEEILDIGGQHPRSDAEQSTLQQLITQLKQETGAERSRNDRILDRPEPTSEEPTPIGETKRDYGTEPGSIKDILAQLKSEKTQPSEPASDENDP